MTLRVLSPKNPFDCPGSSSTFRREVRQDTLATFPVDGRDSQYGNVVAVPCKVLEGEFI